MKISYNNEIHFIVVGIVVAFYTNLVEQRPKVEYSLIIINTMTN